MSGLFAGKGEPFGGLTNERELAKSCPEQFQKDNPWSDYAMKLFFSGGNVSNWKWKSDDPEMQKHQRSCFNGLLGGWGLSHEDKTAIAGWMLSEMLQEVPAYIATKKK